MTNPTSNFGWQMPTSTDLVTDLPADFEVFGQAVDTSLADLKGGTTGQILSKATNTDMDFTWITNDIGDITAVTAGTGISGGGTSGAVTITNDMATTITASGDIVVGTGSGTYDNLPIGTTGQVLTADTTVSPYKVKWAALPSSAPTFVGCRVYNSSDVSISTSTSTTISFPSETFDTNGFHSTTTNTSRITIPTGYAGYYRIDSVGYWDGGPNNLNAANTRIYKNGANAGVQMMAFANAYEGSSMVHINVLNLAVGDYLEVVVTQYSGGTKNWRQNNDYGFFQVQWLGA